MDVVQKPIVDLELIEASAHGVGAADVIFVFGTLHTTPAEVAADHYHRGYSNLIVVTGGESRSRPGHHEALRHRDLLVALGVPSSAIIVEEKSASTLENVTMAIPLVLERVPELRTVLAVVKWYHRRALLTLAHHVTSIEHIRT